VPASDRQAGQHEPYVVGTVGFIGENHGLLYLYLPEKFARVVTSHMLGMSEPEVVRGGRRRSSMMPSANSQT